MDLSSDIRRYPSSMVAALLTVSHTCDGVLYLGDDFRNWTTDYLPEEFQRIYFGVRELRQGAQDVLHLIEPEALKRWPRIDSWTHEDFRVGTNKVYKPLSRCLQTLEDIIHILIPITRWAHGKRYSGVNEAGETVTEALAVVKKTADFVNSLSALDNSIMILKAMEARRTHSDRNFDVFKTFDNMDEDEENVSIQTWFRGLDQSTYLDGFCGTIQQRNSLRRSLFGTEAYSRWRIGLGKSLHIHVVNGINTDILCSNITKDLLHSTQLFRRRAAAYFYFGNVDTSTNDLLRTIIPQLLQQISLETTPKDLRSHLANVCGLPKFSNLYALIDGTNSDEDAQNTVLLKLLEYAISGFDVVYLVLNSVEHCTSNPELSEWLGTLMDEKSGRWHVLNTSYGLPTSNSKSTADTATVVIWGHDFPKQNSLRQEVERFDFQNPGIGENLLQWLCVAMRPLTFEEVFEMFCISSNAERKPTISEFELALAERFQHLVYVTPKELVANRPGTVRYVQLQQSVKGIIQSGDEATVARFHHENSRCCLKYLLRLGPRASTMVTDLSTLAYYAAQYWIGHMRKAQTLGHPKDWTLQHMICSLLDETRHHYQMWCCLMDTPTLPRVQSQGFPEDLSRTRSGDYDPEKLLTFPPPLHYAYVNGLDCAIKPLLQNGSNPNAVAWTSIKQIPNAVAWTPIKQTPLFSSPLFGLPMTSNRLAASWTSIKQFQKPATSSPFPVTLMCLAAAMGDVNLIKRLLDAGVEQLLQCIVGSVRRGVNGMSYEFWQGHLITAYHHEPGQFEVVEIWHGPLTIAASSGHDTCVQVLLDRGLVGLHTNKYLSTALCLAAKNGHRSTVNILLAAGADINQSSDMNYMDPLGQAYKMGFYQMVEKLFPLCNDKTIAAFGKYRGRPWPYSEILVRICKAKSPEDTLYTACRDGLTKVVSETIAKMAASLTDERNLKAMCKAMCIAIKHGWPDIVKVFLAQGKDIAEQIFDPENDKAYALEIACSKGMEEIVLLLLEAGSDPDGATGSAMHNATIAGNLNLVKLLVERGASVEGEFNHTAHLSTINFSHSPEPRLLARVQSFDHTPLYYAIVHRHQDIAQYLLKSSAGTEEAYSRHWVEPALLADAVRTNSIEIITMLLDEGADPSTAWKEAMRTINEDVRDMLWKKELDTALEKAVLTTAELITMLMDNGVITMLLDKGLDPSIALEEAVRINSADLVTMLLDKGADPNTIILKDEDPQPFPSSDKTCIEHPDAESILRMACELGYLDIVKILIERGAQLVMNQEWNPLHLAAFRHRSDVLEYLVSQGGHCRTPLPPHHSPPFTALHYVALNTSPIRIERAHECIEILLAAGADINSKDERGRTPLHYSVGHGSITEYLLKRGADVNLKDDESKSPMDMLLQFQRYTSTDASLSEWVAKVIVLEKALTKGSAKYLGAFCKSHDPGNYT